jgi:hypothetical protein
VRNSRGKSSVRPVSLNRLLGAIEDLETHEWFHVGTIEATLAVSKARAREILSTLDALGLIQDADGGKRWTTVFRSFLEAWEAGDLRTITELLKRFEPFKTFLEFLQEESVLPIPRAVPKRVWDKVWPDLVADYRSKLQSARNAEVAVARLMDSNFVEDTQSILWSCDIRDYSIKELSASIPNVVLQNLLHSHGIGLNLVQVDNMGRWATNVGVTYLSKGFMHFGGDSPSQNLFNQSLTDKYWQMVEQSEYVRLGDLIDSICKELRISLPKFDLYFEQFYEKNKSTIRIAGVAPIYSASEHTMDILNPRGTAAGRFSTRTASYGVILDGVHFTTIRMERET